MGMLAALVGAAFGAAGLTQPRVVNDTASYAQFDFQWPTILQQRRTPGYPAVMAAVRGVAESDGPIPWLHLALFGAAAAIFAWTASDSAVRRVAVFGGLLSANALWLYGNTLATDTPAAALGVAAAAMAVRCGRAATWAAALLAGGLVTAAWLIRPAMLALVVAGPLIAALVRWRAHGRLRSGVAAGGRVAAVTIALLLAWCGLRWAAVGQFGVVSFGGYNLVGVAGQFPGADDVRLEAEALTHVRDRAARLRGEVPPHHAELSAMNYTRLEANYDRVIWEIYEPAAVDALGSGIPDGGVPGGGGRASDAVVNRTLAAIAAAIIRQNPRDYAVWLVKATRQAVRQSLDDFAENPVGLLLLLIIGGGVIFGPGAIGPQTRLVAATAGVYWAAMIALTVLVCPPLGRMTDAASVLWPAAAAMAAVDLWVPASSPRRAYSPDAGTTQ